MVRGQVLFFRSTVLSDELGTTENDHPLVHNRNFEHPATVLCISKLNHSGIIRESANSTIVRSQHSRGTNAWHHLKLRLRQTKHGEVHRGVFYLLRGAALVNDIPAKRSDNCQQGIPYDVAEHGQGVGKDLGDGVFFLRLLIKCVLKCGTTLPSVARGNSEWVVVQFRLYNMRTSQFQGRFGPFESARITHKIAIAVSGRMQPAIELLARRESKGRRFIAINKLGLNTRYWSYKYVEERET